MNESEPRQFTFATGCLIAGAGLIGFIIGMILGIVMFDEMVSKLFRIVGDVSFIISLFCPPVAGICLGGLFTVLGGTVWLFLRRR